MQKNDKIAAPSICLILPAYNKESVILFAIERLVRTLDKTPFKYHLIVVNDGSTDATQTKLATIIADHIQVLNLEENSGKGAAIRTAIEVINQEYDYLGFFDADLDIQPETILHLVTKLQSDDQLSGCIASKTHPESSVSYPRVRRFGSRLFGFASKLLVDVQFGDTQTGAKLFRYTDGEQLIRACKINGFAFDVELLARAHRDQMRISEAPVFLSIDFGSTVKIRSVIQAFSDLLVVRKTVRQPE